jgi:thiol-disulfide isomerase/thioredoxin
MRRRLVAALVALLVGAGGLLSACSGSHPPSYDATKTLKLASPDLVAIKKHSQVPDCPKVASGSVTGGMPSVSLPCLGGGRAVDMAGLRGPMIVNFWASWCGSCRQEMPALAAYAKSHADVEVLGIDFLDQQPGPALELATRSKVAYPLVADLSGALDRTSPLPHIAAMPTTVFLDAQGKIVHIEAVPMSSEQDVADAAAKYLGTGG